MTFSSHSKYKNRRAVSAVWIAVAIVIIVVIVAGAFVATYKPAGTTTTSIATTTATSIGTMTATSVLTSTATSVMTSTATSIATATTVLTSTAVSTVSAPQTPVTLTVWVTYSPGSTEYTAFNDTIAGFETTYPYIHLNIEDHSASSAESDFVTASLANQAPDVLRAASDWTGSLVEAGFLTPLTAFVNSTYLSQFFPAALQDYTYEGHLYGLPENINGLALVYNKAMLPNGPPTTTSQLLSECPSLTKTNSSGAISTACIVFPVDSGYWWWPFLTGFGGVIFNPTNPNQPELNTTAALQSIEFRNSFINDGYMPYNTCCGTMTSMFATGHAAMIIDGPWDEGTYNNDSALPDGYGIAPLPTVSSTGLPMSPLIGAQGWVIASGKPAAETAAAFKFVAWFTDQQHQLDEFNLAGDLPSNALLANSSTITSSPLAEGYLKQAALSAATPNTPAMSEAYTATGAYLITGAPTTPSQVITASDIQSILNSIESAILKAIGSLG